MPLTHTDRGETIMAWVRTLAWTSKLPHADCMKHFKKEVAPALADSPATSMQQVQTGPNSGLFILQFENKRALNQHEKLVGGMRKTVGKDLKMKMTVHDGPVKWSR